VPTLNPRINVTLKPATSALLKRLSQLTRNSQSSIVGELLEAAAPVFSKTVEVLQAAQEAQGSANLRVRENLEAAQDLVHRQMGLVLDDMDTRSADLVEGLEAIARRKRPGRSAQRSASAPRSNRGGANSQPKEKKGKAKSPRGRKHA
jgi:hypothetical protein